MLKNKKVLLAEDDPTMQMFVTGILEQELHCNHVLVCANGNLALDALSPTDRVRTFDLILCDWEMPGAKGDKILFHVRSNRETAKVPFIMTTSRSDKDSIVKVVELGVNDYLIKPFSATALVEKIKKVMNAQGKKSKKKFDKYTALDVDISFASSSSDYKGEIYTISFDKCLVRIPLFKEALYDEAKLKVKFIDDIIDIQAEVSKIEPDSGDPPSRDFMYVTFKIKNIDEVNGDKLNKLLG